MASLALMFIFFYLRSCVNSEVQVENASNSFETYSSEIAAVLNHLNSSSFRVYNYKEATLLHAQTKADITELALDVSVECINKYPDIPCTESVLTCNAFVRKTPEEGSQVLNDVNCKPKPEILVEDTSYPTNLPEADINETKSIALSNEAVSSEVSEPFVAVRRDMAPCLGCPFDLNTDAEGVDELIDLALEHVGTERPQKQALVKVLKLQQQVVAGVKYSLIVEIGSTVCPSDSPLDLSSCPIDSNSDTIVCEVNYLQKPWISKAKHIISNNCTKSQEYVKSDGKNRELSNEINGPVSVSTPNFDQLAHSGNLGELFGSRLSDLESQVVVEDPVHRKEVEVVAPSTVLTQHEEPKIEEPYTTEVLESTTSNDDDRSKRDESSEEGTTVTSDVKRANNSSEESSESVAKVKQANNSSEESSESIETRKVRAIPQLEKITPEEKPLVKNLADFAASALDNIDDDNHKRIILQILGAKKMVGDDGVYYHLIMRMGISRCLEDKPPGPFENCREKLFENYTKICKVQVFVNDDFLSPKVVKSQCQNIKKDKNDSNRTNYSRYKRDLRTKRVKKQVGGETPIDTKSESVTKLLQEGVDHLNAQRNRNKHKPVEITKATYQIVAGKATKIWATLAETSCTKTDSRALEDCEVQKDATPERCKIKVLEKSWKNFKRFSIKCEGDETKYKFETTNRKKRGTRLVGGQTTIDKNSEEVQTLLNEGVNYLNSKRNGNKHKPVEVTKATTQVVAGSLTRIWTKIAETNCPKTDTKALDECEVVKGSTPEECVIKVWQKPWENFKQFTIKCDDDPTEYTIETTTRSKRQVPGGPSSVDKNSEIIKALLNAGISHLNSQRNVNRHKPVEVTKATRQVVAGSSYRIWTKVAETNCPKSDTRSLDDCEVVNGATPKECQIRVWEKDWENFRRFTITCEGDAKEYKVDSVIRAKRHFTTRGGTYDVDKKSDEVKDLLELGVEHFNSRRDANKHKPVEIIKVTEQVVAGFKTSIWAKLAETNCAKTDTTDLENCEVIRGAVPRKCRIDIWEKSWENYRQFTISCEGIDKQYKIETTIRRKRDLEYRPLQDHNLIEGYLEEGLSQLDTQSGHVNKLKVDEIMSVTKQIGAGHIFRIKAKIVVSDCRKTEDTDRQECNSLDNSKPTVCNFRVFEALWKPNSRYIQITCDDDKRKPSSSKVDTPYLPLFNSFITKYRKKYTDKEFWYRLQVFSDNMIRIRELNTYEQGTGVYGVTKFTDMTKDEFSKFLGLRPDLRNENQSPFAQAQIPNIEIPTEFDWRQKGAVTEVKDQKQCGSCWAFSVTGNVEGQFAIKHGKLMEFSEQELVDCDTDDQGCNGGLMDNAYRQIEKLGGLESEQDYPYDAEDEKCHFNKSLARVQLSGALNISHDEGDMAKWLVANGPISIAINANAMQFYFGGVSHPFKFLCSPNSLDHGVLIVGYGVHTYPLFNKTLPYWTVKNSWGSSWGEQGYYRVYRGDGTCGLNQSPSSAIVV